MRMKTRRSPFFPGCLRTARTVLAISLALGGIVGASAQTTPSLTPQQQRFHGIYKELIEINTSHSVGDNTLAARAMEKRLVEAGFAPGDIQIFEPVPKKGNLVLRFKGNGSKNAFLAMVFKLADAAQNSWRKLNGHALNSDLIRV